MSIRSGKDCRCRPERHDLYLAYWLWKVTYMPGSSLRLIELFISNACAVQATYSFLYVDHGLSQSLRFLPKGSQARGTRLKSAILWRQIFHRAKIGVRILYLLFLWCARAYEISLRISANFSSIERYCTSTFYLIRSEMPSEIQSKNVDFCCAIFRCACWHSERYKKLYIKRSFEVILYNFYHIADWYQTLHCWRMCF